MNSLIHTHTLVSANQRPNVLAFSYTFGETDNWAVKVVEKREFVGVPNNEAINQQHLIKYRLN
jgi:hypothetical protein